MKLKRYSVDGLFDTNLKNSLEKFCRIYYHKATKR